MTSELVTDAYALFAGMIDQAAVSRIFQLFGLAGQDNIKHIHLLFQSAGGMVEDGVCLHNFFRNTPIPVTVYNTGTCASAAAIAYLGAKQRKVSAYGTFMLHRTHASPQTATAERLHAAARSVKLDDIRTEAILRRELKLSEAQWADHGTFDLWLSAEEAVDAGLATEIAEFSPPMGKRVFSI